MCYTKDIAKVLSGVAFIEIINHAILAANTLLPVHFFGLIITPAYNLGLLLSWVVIGAFSVYYAWIKKERSLFDRLKHSFIKNNDRF
jgi:hypothetical protein